MTERELMEKCSPQIDEMVSVIREMEEGQYGEFKREYLEEVKRTCPKALGFTSGIFAVIEQELSQTA